MQVTLRDVMDDDLPIFYEQQLDPDANTMAAFTSEDPTDREAFEAHWEKIRNDDTIVLKTILFNDNVAGYVAKFLREDDPEISYWIGKEYWGKGVATTALTQFLAVIEERPLYARVAKDNIGSVRVLEKCGFKVCGEDVYFANARGKEIEEFVFRLDGE
ncbi:GNAT family N-acetyltransferase [bacterium]|nr:GNAT family N-acetyltransferase [bacterium]MBU1652994.1 GNAT family N-acetyltransferase [bacterium]MBU1882457.1 GNAT family N-acetyltransferase [bacterium]